MSIFGKKFDAALKLYKLWGRFNGWIKEGRTMADKNMALSTTVWAGWILAFQQGLPELITALQVQPFEIWGVIAAAAKIVGIGLGVYGARRAVGAVIVAKTG